MADTPTASTSTAPTAPSHDVHFDRSTGKWSYEAADGVEHQYDEASKSWIPVVSVVLLSPAIVI
jgi:hypothetical protein